MVSADTWHHRLGQIYFTSVKCLNVLPGYGVNLTDVVSRCDVSSYLEKHSEVLSEDGIDISGHSIRTRARRFDGTHRSYS